MQQELFYKRKDLRVMTQKRFGFTLAEVLITLGIIGVVAAMTIPTLIANTNGAKFRSQFKKTLSTLNQAGLMAQAQYDFDYAGASVTCGNTTTGTGVAAQHPDSVMSFCAIMNGTLTGQTAYGTDSMYRNSNGTSAAYAWVSTAGSGALANGAALADMIKYTLADGSIVGFSKSAASCELAIGTQLTSAAMDTNGTLKNCVGFIDVNGVTLPNKEVTCTSGSTTAAVETPCAVKNDANHMTDVFPIVFHDATVEPASNAAKYVLTSAK